MDREGGAAAADSSGWMDEVLGREVEVRAAGGEAAGWGSVLGQTPQKAGVVTVYGAGDRPLLLGSTANVRAFLAKRLTPQESGADARCADLGSVADRATFVPVQSGFEADLVYLALTRQRMKAEHQKVLARWGGGVSFARFDPQVETPEPSKVTLAELLRADSRRADPRWMLGPVQEKHAAKLIDGLIDAFDLCRYTNILRQAPQGTACAYKEMGRCAAPCDGSEAMTSYRARVGGAVEAMGRSSGEREAGVRAQMAQAASEARFEEAAALKRVMDRLKALDAPALRGVTTFDRFRHVVVWATGARDKVCVQGWLGGRLGVRAEVGPTVKEAELNAVLAPARTGVVAIPSDEAELESVCVLARWMSAPARKRMRVLRVSHEAWEEDLKVVRKVVRQVAGQAEEPPEVDEVESGSTDGRV